MSHLGDHVPQTGILSDSASEEHLVLSDVRHGTLGDLREHRESGLLNGQCDILERDALLSECDGSCHQPGEGDVHPLDGIW